MLLSCPTDLVSMPHFIKVVQEVKSSALPHVFIFVVCGRQVYVPCKKDFLQQILSYGSESYGAGGGMPQSCGEQPSIVGGIGKFNTVIYP